MARQVKCPYCEEKFDKDEAHEYKKKYYHVNCFQKWNQDKADYETLKLYIAKLLRIEFPTGMILKQIKDYKDKYNYTYKGMELSLIYFFDTLGNRAQEGQGIGIIPFVYEDAKNHYIKQKKIADSLDDMENEETMELVVYLKPNNNKRKTKKIDMSSI